MSDEKKPLKKVSSGRVSITLWKRNFKRSDGSTVEHSRVCLQHSRKDKQTGKWQNQQIWLNIDELRDVAAALDQLNSQEGDDSPSPSANPPLQSSVRVHHIVEFIKANSLDAGLDVFDLEEVTVEEILTKFGIHAELTSWEKALFLSDLKNLTEQREFAEMAYQVNCML